MKLHTVRREGEGEIDGGGTSLRGGQEKSFWWDDIWAEAYRKCILPTWCEELTHWKRPWPWEILRAGGEGDDRGWDGWIASLTRWSWVWVVSRGWWWTGKPGVLQSMGSQIVRHDSLTQLTDRVSLSLASMNVINLILELTIWWYPCVESSLVLLEKCVCYDPCVLLTNLC